MNELNIYVKVLRFIIESKYVVIKGWNVNSSANKGLFGFCINHRSANGLVALGKGRYKDQQKRQV